MKKMVAVYAYLGSKSPFDQAVWERMLKLAASKGFNTVLLEISDGVEYPSHPELSANAKWTAEQVHREVARCRELGIALIPQMNFSAGHDKWLGEYSKMLATDTYRRVTAELIQDVYEMFEGPAYINLGMDEENEFYVQHNQRPGGLYWKDMRHLLDSVKATGATPWIWADALFEHPQDYATYIAPEDAVLSPWYYHAFKEEHFTPTDSRPEYVEYYGRERFTGRKPRYVEEDPFHSTVRLLALPLLKRGYRYIPCASIFNHCDYNAPELVEYFTKGTPDSQLLGFMTAPWAKLTEENWEKYSISIEGLAEAIAKFGPVNS